VVSQSVAGVDHHPGGGHERGPDRPGVVEPAQGVHPDQTGRTGQGAGSGAGGQHQDAVPDWCAVHSDGTVVQVQVQVQVQIRSRGTEPQVHPEVGA